MSTASPDLYQGYVGAGVELDLSFAHGSYQAFKAVLSILNGKACKPRPRKRSPRRGCVTSIRERTLGTPRPSALWNSSGLENLYFETNQLFVNMSTQARGLQNFISDLRNAKGKVRSYRLPFPPSCLFARV